MATRLVNAAFKQHEFILPIESLVLQKEVKPAFRKSNTYKQIAASLEHVGLIEPVVVFPRAANDYLVLDGHARLDILKSNGVTQVRAILATDDEAYTYNKRVNHAPPIAQHFMILKALANGLNEERIAASLNVDVANIRKKRDMLDGICPEAIELLKTSHVTADAFAALRRMKPIRQIEAAEHMVASGTYSVKFAKALLAVTRPEFLLEAPSSKRLEATSKGARLMFEQETAFLVKDLKAVEASYGRDILALTVICGYFERLLGNERVQRHLVKYHQDVLNSVSSLI
ncbi:MAG TPA: plasmid partitioning protein RepB C-terminal domain-containing protein, partial [Nitrospira sp.]|nr:plasmid partitioning protein RepB C-terminal domain-containing protein [Nitrospira sp.]